MTSRIAWLDINADGQRRAREMLALFTQTESRDELGVGQIRDVLSDSLWPGSPSCRAGRGGRPAVQDPPVHDLLVRHAAVRHLSWRRIS